MKNDLQVETGIKQGVLYGYDSGFVTHVYTDLEQLWIVSSCFHTDLHTCSESSPVNADTARRDRL